MNIANPCRIFVLASALAFTFGLRADGTMPIPGADAETQFPMLLGGAASLDASFSRDISVSLDISPDDSVTDVEVTRACASAGRPTSYPAGGSIVFEEQVYDVKALCVPLVGGNKTRSVIATLNGTRLSLDGEFKKVGNQFNFAGKMKKFNALSSSPESGELGSAQEFDVVLSPVVP